MRNDIVFVEAFKLGNEARFARFQSTSSTESCLEQNSRSSSSESNLGIGFKGFRRGMFVLLSLGRGHVARRNESNCFAADRVADEEAATDVGPAESIVPDFISSFPRLPEPARGGGVHAPGCAVSTMLFLGLGFML